MNGIRVGITRQITLFVVMACLINLACSVMVGYFNFRNMYEESNLHQNTEMAVNIAKAFKKIADEGEMSVQEAQDRALQAIGAIRYDGTNYVWVNDYNTTMLVNPTVKRGTDASIIKDKSAQGKPFFKNITEGAKASKDGTHYEYYDWIKPGHEKPLTKYSYGVLFPDWQWVIATGLYSHDVDQVLFVALKKMIAVSIVATILILLVIRFLFISRLSDLLRNIAKSLTRSTVQVSDAAAHLEDSSRQLAEGTTAQASSVQEIAATIEESASMIRKCEESTKIAVQLVKEVNQDMDSGADKMKSLIEIVEKINVSSARIANIIKTIDAIAFQTNILSLNAAVEASRAGDAGRGFAVVAEEVRSLARRSTASASETASLINESISLYAEAAKMAEEAGQSMNQIKEQTSKVNNLINEIASATKEQSVGIEQISTAILKVEEVLQVNKSAAGETSTDSEQLTLETAMLDGLATDLTFIVEGS